MLAPIWTVRIQSRDIAEEDLRVGLIEAMKLDVVGPSAPHGVNASATIEASTSEGAGGLTLQLNLSGIKPSDAQQFKPDRLLQVEAGYDNGPQLVFHGIIDSVGFRINNAKRTWTITASSAPAELLAVTPSFSSPKALTIGETIHKVMESVGLRRSFVTPLAFGDASSLGVGNAADFENAITLQPEELNFTEPAINVLDNLITKLKSAISEHLGLERNIGLAPARSEALILDIIDFESNDLGATMVVDAFGPFIRSAGPETFRVASAEENEEGGETPIESAENRYSISSVFDPRVGLGLVVNAKDPDFGNYPFSVDKYKHNLSHDPNGWSTDYDGPIFTAVSS